MLCLSIILETKTSGVQLKWWAILESNQARVASAELQSAAAPCSTSPTECGITKAPMVRQG